MWLVQISASVTMLGLNFVLGHPITGYSGTTYLTFVATAIISQLLGYLASSYALGHLPASIVSVTMIGQPVTTAIVAVPLLGEVPTPSQLGGGIVALIGIYVANLAHIRASKAIDEANN